MGSYANVKFDCTNPSSFSLCDNPTLQIDVSDFFGDNKISFSFSN